MFIFPLKQRECRYFIYFNLKSFLGVYFNFKHKMNTKERGIYMPQFYMIPMYNIVILVKIETESEAYQFEYYKTRIEKEPITVESICKWCIVHNIRYGIKYRFYKYRQKIIIYNIINLIRYMQMIKSLKKFKKNY